MNDKIEVKIGGTQCDAVLFISSDDKPLVGVQLYKDGEPMAWVALSIEHARIAIIDLENAVARASVNRQ